MQNLIDLEPYGDNRQLRMIVKTPRGSNIKLEYEPKLRAFTVSRALPLGLVYPYDWGFIRGIKAEDGDPIDALAVHDGATYPGLCSTSALVRQNWRLEEGRISGSS